MLTLNADNHPLMNRMHKPDPKLPPDQQDKRSLRRAIGHTAHRLHRVITLGPAPGLVRELDKNPANATISAQGRYSPSRKG